MALVLKLIALIGEDIHHKGHHCAGSALSNIPSSSTQDGPHSHDFHIDMNLRTVHEVWQEFRVGARIRPSVLEVNGEHGNYDFATSPAERRMAIIRGRIVEMLEEELRYGRELREVLQVAEARLQHYGGDFAKLLDEYEAKKKLIARN